VEVFFLTFQPFEHELILNNIHEYSSYLTEDKYISATKPNQLLLLREIMAVYCENHTNM
jgi:hypothetical protein